MRSRSDLDLDREDECGLTEGTIFSEETQVECEFTYLYILPLLWSWLIRLNTTPDLLDYVHFENLPTDRTPPTSP